MALGACLWSMRVNAEDVKPVAECKDGKCVMSEEDFKRLQEFVAAVQKVSEENDSISEDVNQRLDALQSKVAKCDADRHRNVWHRR